MGARSEWCSSWVASWTPTFSYFHQRFAWFNLLFDCIPLRGWPKTLYFDNESDRLDLSRDIDAIMEWISTNQVELNISKFQFLPLLSSRHEPIVLGTITVTPSRLVNDIGLKIESNLNWATHIKHSITKANGAYQLVRRNFSPSLPPRSKLNVFKTSILRIVCYANQCWCPSKSSVAELE